MNNAATNQETDLVIFGGLVADVNPPDLPKGSSPICTDMDFNVGAVRTRDGLVNVYSYGSTYLDCDTASGTNVAGLDVPWTNPGGVVDASCATVEVNTPSGPQPPTQLGFEMDVSTSGDAVVSLPISTQKVVVLAGTSYAAYVVGDTLGSLSPALFQLNQVIPDTGIVGHMSVGLSASTTRSFSGADDWTVHPTQFAIGTSIVAIEYDGLNLGTVAAPDAPVIDSSLSLQGTLTPTGSPVISAGTGFTADAAYQYVEDVIGTPIAVCVEHMQAGAPGTYAVTFDTNVGTISAGNVTTALAGDWIIAIAALNGTNGDWGVCAYAIPLANPSGPTAGPTSQQLNVSAFPCLLSAPAGIQVTGMQLTVTGFQSNEDPSSLVSVTLVNPTVPVTPRTFQLPSHRRNRSAWRRERTHGGRARPTSARKSRSRFSVSSCNPVRALKPSSTCAARKCASGTRRKVAESLPTSKLSRCRTAES